MKVIGGMSEGSGIIEIVGSKKKKDEYQFKGEETVVSWWRFYSLSLGKVERYKG